MSNILRCHFVNQVIDFTAYPMLFCKKDNKIIYTKWIKIYQQCKKQQRPLKSKSIKKEYIPNYVFGEYISER
jgi:hypothetical protein